MTHLHNLETLQFAVKAKHFYTCVLQLQIMLLFNFMAKTWEFTFLEINFQAAHWPHNLANFP